MSKSAKGIIFTAIIIAFSFICVYTNPSKDQYVSWAKEHYTASDSAEAGTLKIDLTEIFSQLFGSAVITNNTSSQNYVLFTLYDTKLTGKEVKVIGILNNFIPIYFSDSSQTS